MAMQQEELKKVMRTRWDKKGVAYDDAFAHGTKSPEERECWRKILERLGPGGLSVLDVGTGTGFVALLLAEIGHQVTGIDWSKTMLDQASKKSQQENLSISFVEGETERLPFKTGSFDALVARHVLWTLTEPQQALAEWYRVLKQGGKVMADYSQRNPGTAGHHYPAEIEEKLPLNKNVDPEEIAALFTGAGFIDVQVEVLDSTSKHNKITFLISGEKA